jgi:hypothetical protein
MRMKLRLECFQTRRRQLRLQQRRVKLAPPHALLKRHDVSYGHEERIGEDIAGQPGEVRRRHASRERRARD